MVECYTINNKALLAYRDKSVVRVVLNYKIMNFLIPVLIVMGLQLILMLGNDLLSAIAAVSCISVFILFKFDYRIPVALGILLLMVSAISLQDSTISDSFAVQSYWLFFVGILTALLAHSSKVFNSSAYKAIREVLRIKNENWDYYMNQKSYSSP